jgi:hypothetical protein
VIKLEHIQALMPVIFAGLVAQRGPEFQAAMQALQVAADAEKHMAQAAETGEKTDGSNADNDARG